MSRALRAVCVFCGAAGGGDPGYVEAARRTGGLLAQAGIELVYGGGHVGTMGALADAALAAGGRVLGVIPRHLMRPEVAHQGLTELRVVDSMHERKQVMAERADAFLVLPGGYGTLDETFEIVTWRQLELHRKPVALVNLGGYFDHLLAFLAHAVHEGFVHAPQRRLLHAEKTSEAALAWLEREATHGASATPPHRTGGR
ncbi:MAG TPA: TIGR00730 family Rossman fold protein [Burkholderiaceae bacterium]